MNVSCEDMPLGSIGCDRLRAARDVFETRSACIKLGRAIFEETEEKVSCPVGEIEVNPRLIEDIKEAQALVEREDN